MDAYTPRRAGRFSLAELFKNPALESKSVLEPIWSVTRLEPAPKEGSPIHVRILLKEAA